MLASFDWQYAFQRPQRCSCRSSSWIRPPLWASEDVVTTRPPEALTLSTRRLVRRNGARWLTAKVIS